jgi:hypothetical protein
MHMDRHQVRLLGAALAAAMAAIYVLIGLGVLVVVEPVDGGPSMLSFGLSAGTAFLLGAVLLGTQDRRILWVAGIGFQILVIAMYFAVAPSRTPSYEVWGLTLRVLQVPLTLVLVRLAWSAPPSRVSARP